MEEEQQIEETKDVILVVDDAKINIDIIDGLLDDIYDLVVATSGKKALKLADKIDNIDLILLDIEMPEMDGYEVCAKLKANDKTKDIPIIFITARTDIMFIGRKKNPRLPYFGLKSIYLYLKVFCKSPLYHLSLCLKSPLNFEGHTV